MQIGELAERTGVSRRMLRYYEQHGLLHARRGRNGWRDYDDAAVDRVRLIADMLRSGLTVDGVRRLAPCLDRDDPSDCADPDLPLRTYRARLEVLQRRLSELRRHHDRLARRVESLEHEQGRPPGEA